MGLNARHRSDQERLAAMDRRIRLLLREIYGTSSTRHETDSAVVDDLLGKSSSSNDAISENAVQADRTGSTAGAPSESPAAASTGAQAATRSSGTLNSPASTSSTTTSSTTTSSSSTLDRTKRRSRLQLPEWLQPHDEYVEVPESERTGPDGRPLQLLGHKISWRLDYVPPHFLRVRILRAIYGVPFQEHTQVIAALSSGCENFLDLLHGKVPGPSAQTESASQIASNWLN